MTHRIIAAIATALMGAQLYAATVWINPSGQEVRRPSRVDNTINPTDAQLYDAGYTQRVRVVTVIITTNVTEIPPDTQAGLLDMYGILSSIYGASWQTNRSITTASVAGYAIANRATLPEMDLRNLQAAQLYYVMFAPVYGEWAHDWPYGVSAITNVTTSEVVSYE